MTAPTNSAYLQNVASPSPEAARSPYELNDALRTVLGSHQKLRLLCVLDTGEMTTTELADAVAGKMRRQAINLHLAELKELGWIRVAGGEKRNPFDPLRWGLTTAPMWRELATSIIAQAADPAT